jgi:hypothetical protein
MQSPSTVGQVMLLVLFVLPGAAYQFLRERWRGPVPGETDVGQRVLRAVTASIALNGVYVVVAGPALVTSWRRAEHSGVSELIAGNPRITGAWVLLLFLGVPAAAAAAVSFGQRRRAHAVYRSAPTAWDYVFGDRRHSGPRFVRARLKDGTWVGGWFGGRSYASGYPQTADLYLQWAYQMGSDGSFGPLVKGSAGVYIRMEDVDIVELIQAPVGASEPEERNEACHA